VSRSRKSTKTAAVRARWRAACVDGLLHAAYAAAVAAESTAQRCSRRPARRGVRRLMPVRGRRLVRHGHR